MVGILVQSAIAHFSLHIQAEYDIFNFASSLAAALLGLPLEGTIFLTAQSVREVDFLASIAISFVSVVQLTMLV